MYKGKQLGHPIADRDRVAEALTRSETTELAVKVVDPSNPIPKYIQISTWLQDLIRAGRYRQGDRLPSELELSKICSVHRNTLRQAIAELVSQGILRKEKGRGTFVASTAPARVRHRLKRISSFRDDLTQIGYREKTVLIHSGTEEANDHIAEVLMLGAARRVFTIQRLRTGDGIPLIFEKSYLPEGMFTGILSNDLTGSMYQLLTEKYHTRLARSEQNIRAVNLQGTIAALLTIPENSAGLFMESITYNQKNVPVEVLFSYYRGDKYIFEVELGHYRLDNVPAV